MPNGYDPFVDPSIPQSKMPSTLVKYFSSYYAHPYVAYDLADLPVVEKQKREFNASSFQMRMHDVPPFPPSSEVGDTEEFSATIDIAPAMRSEKGYRTINPARLQSLIEDTFIQKHDREGKTTGLNYSILILYGNASVWGTIRGSWEMENDVIRWKSEGRRMRQVDFRCMDGANHFVSMLLFMSKISE